MQHRHLEIFALFSLYWKCKCPK